MIGDGRKSRIEEDHCVYFESSSSAREGVRVGSFGVTVNDSLDGRVYTQGSKSNAQKDLHHDNQQSRLWSASPCHASQIKSPELADSRKCSNRRRRTRTTKSQSKSCAILVLGLQVYA